MKKLYLYMLTALIAMAFSACGEDNTEVEIITAEYLKVSHTVQSEDGDGVRGVLKIQSNCAWKIRTTSGVTIDDSGSGDAELDFTCPAVQNLIRHDTITVVSASGRLMPKVVVAQYPTEEVLDIDKDELVFDNTGEVKLLAVIANTSWVMTCKDDWISCSTLQDEGTKAVEITAKPNPTGVQRQTSITIRGKKGKERTVTVYQRDLSQNIEITPETINAKAEGGEYILQVSGNLSWQAAAEQTWVTLDRIDGEGDGTITLTVEPNRSADSREATVTVKAYGIKRICTLKQEGAKAPEILWSEVVMNVDRRSVTARAEVVSMFDITECGFCYSATNQMPTVRDTKVSAAVPGVDNIITATISDLKSGATYTVRAYARNAVGIVYGEAHQIIINGVPGENDNPLPEHK